MDKLEALIDRLLQLVEKSCTVAEPHVNTKLNQFEKWLDSKVDNKPIT